MLRHYMILLVDDKHCAIWQVLAMQCMRPTQAAAAFAAC
jgi:hypothetical protein